MNKNELNTSVQPHGGEITAVDVV